MNDQTTNLLNELKADVTTWKDKYSRETDDTIIVTHMKEIPDFE